MPEPLISGERVLNGPEKAAALLLMLGPPTADGCSSTSTSPICASWRAPPPGSARSRRAMLDRLVDEFAADFSAGTNLLGDAGQARNLLAEALPPERGRRH